ncbi:divergent protein kinase domain 2A [Schistocerca americana]|uniref:divergent protein kinase domain 2A n=1 Tax=Schistocerca americana TaxID=7009 RepID=UPI001F4F51BB|nr:divergent protein kinase domain 2A [Schistocerca americana]
MHVMCVTVRRKKLKSCVCVIVILLIFRLIARYVLSKNIRELADLGKCPACYGVDLCPIVLGDGIKLINFDSLASVINIIGYKNVWFGTYKNAKIVVKKLGSDWELEQLDNKLCGNEGRNCNVTSSVSHVTNLSVIENYMKGLTSREGSVNDVLSGDFYVCPTTSGVNRLLQHVKLRNEAIDTKTFLQNVWTIMHINPEPLILQILPKEDGWPVPFYYGACGRLIIEEYAGETLTTYYTKPWLERAKLAQKLLVAAKKLTNDHPGFRFYLTDVSPDNIAVDASGSVYFIDLEDVIIVDRNIPDHEKPVSWTSQHVSELYECASCFTFSRSEICNHHISDHNLYAVCQHLLSPKAVPGIMPGGLLHSTPHLVLENYPDLPLILTQCGESAAPFGRFKAANQLLHLLANITETHKTIN